MSGHYATLLRGTVERMLPEPRRLHHRLARREAGAARREGSFDLDDYIDYLIEFLEPIGETGERPHMLAVCQPSVPAYAATALMSADKNPWRPKTLTMMGGPIDTREAPTAVNTLATAAAVQLVRAQRHRDRADDLPGRGPEGLSRASSSSPAS